MKKDEIKEQINSIIRDEIQDVINEYVDSKEESEKSGLGFVESEADKELKINVNSNAIKKVIKDYKKIKKYMKSPLYQVKKMDGSESVVTKLMKEIEDT